MKLSVLCESSGFKAAVAIVLDNREYILCGRSTAADDRYQKWCFPGGGLNGSIETPEKGAERECQEETNCKVYAIDRAFSFHKKPGVAFVVCKFIDGLPKPNHEFSELKWFSPSELMVEPDLYPINRQILRNLNLS